MTFHSEAHKEKGSFGKSPISVELRWRSLTSTMNISSKTMFWERKGKDNYVIIYLCSQNCTLAKDCCYHGDY